MFLRKDFPQRMGLTIVVVFGLVASVFFFLENIPATFLVLSAAVVVDALLYLVVGKVTVCYRCRGEFRGFGYNADLEGFDLAVAEKYRSTSNPVSP